MINAVVCLPTSFRRMDCDCTAAMPGGGGGRPEEDCGSAGVAGGTGGGEGGGLPTVMRRSGGKF